MDGLNATVQCFSRSSVIGLSSLISSVRCSKKRDGRYAVDDFDVALFLNLRGSVDVKNETLLDRGGRLEFKLRLTENFGQHCSYDLSEWVLDLSDKNRCETFWASNKEFSYLDLINVANVRRLCVETPGECVIKLLVREAGEEKYEVQAVRSLFIDSGGSLKS